MSRGETLKALRPVFRQVPTPGCQSDTGRRCRKPNRKTNHMQTLIEQPADSAGRFYPASLSKRERETTLQRLRRLRKEASAEIERSGTIAIARTASKTTSPTLEASIATTARLHWHNPMPTPRFIRCTGSHGNHRPRQSDQDPRRGEGRAARA